MKLSQLKEVVDKACQQGNENCDVEFWIKLDDESVIPAEISHIRSI